MVGTMVVETEKGSMLYFPRVQYLLDISRSRVYVHSRSTGRLTHVLGRVKSVTRI